MDFSPELGKIITDGNRCRDAIHVAIAPVTATCELRPGQHVGLVEGSREQVSSEVEPIGIVDPFLNAPVKIGERFWLFLYPNSVTGMRHAWSHPAFRAVPLDIKEEVRDATK